VNRIYNKKRHTISLLKGDLFAEFDFVPGARFGHWAGEKGLILKGICPACKELHPEPIMVAGSDQFTTIGPHGEIYPAVYQALMGVPYIICPTIGYAIYMKQKEKVQRIYE
jgi:hypothetical protein